MKFKETDTPATKPARPPTPPEGCTAWFDGCNNCGVENGKVTICTMMWCETPTAPAKCNAYSPPGWCKSWFDGCNTCQVKGGKLGGCTKKLCSGEKEQPHCVEYLED